jgi:hypothetical protein
MTFSQYLGLRDLGRDTLEPDAERDVDLYQDLDGTVGDVERRLAVKAPKLVVFGQYGTGKTHLLHVAKARMDAARFTPVYVKLEARGKVGESRLLHTDILARLEAAGVLKHAYGTEPAEADQNLQNALRLLGENPSHPEARAWLLAHGPTPSQARRVGFTTRLSDYAGGVQYEKIWRMVGDAYRRATERELILLIDESETFQDTVDPNRVADLGAALREMFDSGNKSYGVLMGLTAPRARSGSHPLFRPDVATRIQNAQLRLEGLSDVERREAFLGGLLAAVLLPGRAFLTPPALRWLAEKGPDIARQFMIGVEREPVQREYVKLLDRLARDAFASRRSVPISPGELVDWVDGRWT